MRLPASMCRLIILIDFFSQLNMTCVIREIPELCWNFSKRIPLCADSTQRFKYESPTLLELSTGGKISEGIFIFVQPPRNFWYVCCILIVKTKVLMIKSFGGLFLGDRF